MKQRWYLQFKGIEKEAVNNKIMAAGEVLDALKEMIQNDLNEVVKQTRNNDNYFLPAWSERQADYIGQQKAYEKILSLLP